MSAVGEERALILPSDDEISLSERGTLRKEPSFSRWCFDFPPEANCSYPESTDSDDADKGFELPLLRPQQEENSPLEDNLKERSHFTNGVMQVSQGSLHLRQGTERENNFAVAPENKSRRASFNIEYNDKNKESKMYALQINDGNPEDLVSKAAPKDSNMAPVTDLLIRPLFYIIMWYTFSTCLTLYNKLLVGEKMGKFSLFGEKMGKFPAPLLMNTIHFSMQGLVSTLVLRFFYPAWHPQSMSWKDYFTRAVPTAVATALDIDLSNASLVFISVTFETMCKSSAPVFLLLFAFAFKLETPSFKLLGIILVISIGVMLTVAKSEEFNFWGFLFVMLAAIMSGFRWTVTQILLQKEEYGLTNPFATMRCLTPVMALITAILSLISEPWSSLLKTRYFDTPRHFFGSSLLMLLGGSLAFFMVLAEYLLISATSAVTFTVAGIVKEVVTIVVAILFFHDQFTVLKGIGLAVIIFGVSLFNWYKYLKMRKTKSNEINNVSDMKQNGGPVKYVILENMDEDIDGVEQSER